MRGVYDRTIENRMRQLYDSFSEKDRRRYAAIEADKLGHGGIAYIANLFQCHPETITRGKKRTREPTGRCRQGTGP